MAPRNSKTCRWHPGAPKLPPEEPSTALNGAPGAPIVKQKAPGSHQCPHFGTDAFRYLTIWEQNQKNSRGHRQGISDATLGLSSSRVFLSFLFFLSSYCFLISFFPSVFLSSPLFLFILSPFLFLLFLLFSPCQSFFLFFF